jgi:hypothetical protein
MLGVNSARSPKLDDALATLLMSAVPRILARWAVGENQTVGMSAEQSGYGFLNQFSWQGRLIGLIIKIRHFTLCSKLLQSLAELRCAIQIRRST